MQSLFDDFKWRGIVHLSTDEAALRKSLDEGAITAYAGFDPTADSLHVGNLMLLMTMARLQQSGHRVILLAGGATGMIGDPSFKAQERALLDEETLAHNVKCIEEQLSRFLDMTGPNAAQLTNNAKWTANLSVIEFLRDVGKHVTVNTLLARDAIRTRLEDREQGISFTEFSYSLLQANDYVHLAEQCDCVLQVGGSDQWGNIVAGVDMVRRRLNRSVHALGTPLVTKADGTKFGKSVSGAPWLDAKKMSPYKMYQFWLAAEDAKVIDYLKFFTFLSHDEINQLELQVQTSPAKREAQKRLALEMTTRIHGIEETNSAISASAALFGEDIASLREDQLLDVFSDVPSVDCPRSQLEELTLVSALVSCGLVPSTSAARQAITQGGVTVNNLRRDDVDDKVTKQDLLHDSFVVLRRGKKNFALLRFV